MSSYYRWRKPVTNVDLKVSSPVAEPATSLGAQTRRGVAWTGASTMLISAIGLVTNLVLARIIAPSHFGLLGMATVFTGLVRILSEMGVASALIRRPESVIDDEVLATAFWTSAGVSAALFLCTSLALAPAIASFYDTPALRAVVVIVSLPLLIRPAGVIHRVQLSRALRFKSLSMVDATSTAFGSVVTIGLALAGMGVWSIALTGTLTAAASLPLLWRELKWSPSLRFSIADFRNVLSFGSLVTGSEAAVFITKNVDYLIIGRLLGAQALGVYTLAFLMTDTFRSAMMGVMNKVMYPVYGRLQGDVATLGRYYLRVIRYNTLVIVPLMVVLLVLAPAVIRNVFGPEWLPGADASRLLAAAVILHTIGGTSAAVLKGLGRADLEFRINLATAALVAVPALLIGVHLWGITGAGAAALVHTIATRFLFQTYMRRLVGVSEWMILRSVGPALASGLVAGAVGIVLTRLTPNSGLLATVVIVCAILGVYVLACGLLLRDELRLVLTDLQVRSRKTSVTADPAQGNT
jgi:teichuronic acid exporter